MNLDIQYSEKFENRHISPNVSDTEKMLASIGVNTIDTLIEQTVPAKIRLAQALRLPAAKSEAFTTFSIPSAPQKRFCAKGKSRETHTTFVLSIAAARWLNVRTDAAHVGVSILGKIFKITLLPAKFAKLAIDKSFCTNLKSIALEPTFGNSPLVFIGFPPNVTTAIIDIFFKHQK
jgi:hypothetical protein